MVEIVLVRHASTAWSGVRYCGSSDPPLTSSGVAEARALAESLASTLPDEARIIASPSRRALATASVIADVIGISSVELDERWREADVGLAEGRTFEELAAVAPDVAAALAAGELEIDWPGGESHASLWTRVSSAWAELLADGRPSVVVTHAGPLLHACAIAERRAVAADDLVGPATARRLEVLVRSTAATVLPSPA